MVGILEKGEEYAHVNAKLWKIYKYKYKDINNKN